MSPKTQKSCLLNECKGTIVKNTLTPAKQAPYQRPAAADQRGTTAPRFTMSDRQTGGGTGGTGGDGQNILQTTEKEVEKMERQVCCRWK